MSSVWVGGAAKRIYRSSILYAAAPPSLSPHHTCAQRKRRIRFVALAPYRPTEEEEEATAASAAMADWREEASDSEVDLDSYTSDMGDGDDNLDDDQIAEEEGGEEGTVLEGEDTDEDYEQLLGRVYGILGENNPGLAGRTHMTVMTSPSVLREGTKKTVFANFMGSCQKIRRDPRHVMDYLLSELATSGSLDGQQRLVVKGRFAPRNFEQLLRRYIYEYVICNGCKGTDTTLSRENRLLFLRCEQCGSSRSVAPIRAGFIARVTRVRA